MREWWVSYQVLVRKNNRTEIVMAGDCHFNGDFIRGIADVQARSVAHCHETGWPTSESLYCQILAVVEVS